MAALQDSLVKSAHSELALFDLYWLVVTFPCGKSAHSGDDQVESRKWWAAGVCQVLPSYQNRQIGALDETAVAHQSSLFISVL